MGWTSFPWPDREVGVNGTRRAGKIVYLRADTLNHGQRWQRWVVDQFALRRPGTDRGLRQGFDSTAGDFHSMR